jgi:ubiquinone/menaquinone biosynthesis C-methylase UbiE
MEAMAVFLRDYEMGLYERRYLSVSLPKLPFTDGAFDLVVCSHLLFLYDQQLSETFHIESIREMVRVADNVRIFPIVSLNGQRSSYLASVQAYCSANGIQADVVDVDYHFQKGAYQMIQLTDKIV